ncbi:MAG TPA: calcium-binding protein [Solirubrobacterales bacterium]|nr:calcium-binding protein [Solirubrobacterales bacterium]
MGGNDTIEGGEGNDTLGGDSDEQHDNVSEGGSDVIRGGAGDDRLTGDATSTNAVIGHDVLDGGPGTDTVYDDWYRFDDHGNSEDPAPRVTFDGLANDGRPGEDDDVIGIERVDTGYQPAAATPGTYVGDEGPDTFNLIFTNGNVRAGGGDDVVTGGDASDAIEGGGGNDSLSGGFGDDTITGGPGQDDIGGDRTADCFYGPVFGVCTIGTGNDTIHAQDGEHDTIDCGLGADVAYVDSIDTVTACETVYVTTPPPPPAPTKPTKKNGDSASDPAKVGKIPPQRFARLVSHGLRVQVSCSRACGLNLKLTASRSTAKKLRLPGHAKSTTLATRKASFAKHGRKTIALTLRRSIRNRLGHQRPRPSS